MNAQLRQFSMVLALLLIPGITLAQSGSVRGTVTDAVSGESLPGVNVFLEGTTLGAAASPEGRYVIPDVPSGEYTLVASFIGFRRYRSNVIVRDGEDVVHDIELQEDRLGLDEVVVTGQGSGIEKRRLSTTVEVITPAQIEQTPTTRLDQLLQAQLPNTQVRFSSGQSGTASLIRSRGVMSANSETTPVIYVDGVRVDNLNTGAALGLDTGGAQSSTIADIPAENIERIEFIKGGAATTLYGSDAAGGVIQIFTKRGLPGRSSFTFETEMGASVGTEDYLQYDETAEIVFRPGLYQSYRLGASGGTGDITYSFSGRILGDEGFRYPQDQRRYDLRTTLGARINDVTRYTGSFAYVSNSFVRDNNANSSWGQFGQLEQGDWGLLPELTADSLEAISRRVRTITDLVDISYDVDRFQTSQMLELNPMPSLTAKFTAGVDYRVSNEKEVGTNAYLVSLGAVAEGTDDQGYIDGMERRFFGLTLEGTLQHQGDLGPASFVTTGGVQIFRDDDQQIAYSADNVTEGSRSINNAAITTSEDFQLTVANYGFYLNENVGLADRLFLEGGFRVDGNSAFGEEVGLQFYPRLGIAYTLSEESFFEAVPTSVISNLKLRANYGAAGKFPTPFANDRTIASNPFMALPSFTFDQPGNPDLRPEKVYTYEVGADMSLLSDHVALELTYYHATTVDALFEAPYAPSTGQEDQLRNVGEIVNRGLELSSNVYLVSRGDLDVRFNASFNTLHNEVTDNGGTAPFNVGGFQFLGAFVDEGQPVGYLRGAQPEFDEEGNLVNVEYNQNLGSVLPDYFGNAGLTARYKRLSLYVTGDYQLGAQAVNLDEVLRYFNDLGAGGRTFTDDRIPDAAYGESYTDLGGVWVEDTDYFKVRLVSLSYRLPDRLVRRGGLQSATLGFSVTNPLNVVSSTFDPEVTGAGIEGTDGVQGGVSLGGFGYSTESAPRRYLFNLKVGF